MSGARRLATTPRHKTWRECCAPIIRAVIERVGKNDMKALKKALREAYPWYERKYHPYKIWCSEIRRQLAFKAPPEKPRIKETGQAMLPGLEGH